MLFIPFYLIYIGANLLSSPIDSSVPLLQLPEVRDGVVDDATPACSSKKYYLVVGVVIILLVAAGVVCYLYFGGSADPSSTVNARGSRPLIPINPEVYNQGFPYRREVFEAAIRAEADRLTAILAKGKGS
jgi:hypothetical protein